MRIPTSRVVSPGYLPIPSRTFFRFLPTTHLSPRPRPPPPRISGFGYLSDPIPDAEVGYRLRCRVHVSCGARVNSTIYNRRWPPSEYSIRRSFPPWPVRNDSYALYRGESLSLDKVSEELPGIVVRYSEEDSFYLLLRHDAAFYGSAMCVDFTALR